MELRRAKMWKKNWDFTLIWEGTRTESGTGKNPDGKTVLKFELVRS